MTIGDKIKELRKEKGYSQEQLAQDLYVSRAAVAKWEAGNGIPDIENLKKLSGVFEISIDELLDNHLPSKNKSLKDNLVDVEVDTSHILVDTPQDYYYQFMGRKCDFNLRDWNDGEYGIYVVGCDERFVYYLKEEGNKKSKDGYERTMGAINKAYIDSVSFSESEEKKGKKKDVLNGELPTVVSDVLANAITAREISKEFFVGKTADVYLEDKHIWSGILTKSTELFDVGIKALDGDKLVLVTDRVIEIKDISKIEVNLN